MPRPNIATLAGLILSFSQIHLHGDIVVTWEDDFVTTLKDFSGTDLTQNVAGTNSDGDLMELGYYSESDDSNLFRGTWNVLTKTTTVGDSSDLSGLGDGAFSFSTSFNGTTATTYAGDAGQITDTGVTTPSAGTLLAIRFYDGSTNAAGTLFNVIAAPQGAGSSWYDWPTSDVDPQAPALSADNNITGLKFLTDNHNSSDYDFKTAATDIDTGTTITSFQGALYLTGNSAGGTLTTNLSSPTTFSGVIADGAFTTTGEGQVALTKTGSGTLTFDGSDALTYTGNTTLSAGGLTLSNGATISNSENIILSSGTTLTVSGLSSTFTIASGQTLEGEGSVSGATDIADGGAISPGNDASNQGIGEISITGAATWNQGMTYHWEINDLAGDAGDADANGLGWDHMSYTGALTISGNASNKILIDIAALDGYNSPYNQQGSLAGTQRPALNREHADGYQFAIVTASGGISGFDASYFEINYTDFYEQWDDPFHNWDIIQSGNSLYLTYSAVPEPSTYIMVSGLLLLPAVTIYRRCKKKKSKAGALDTTECKQSPKPDINSYGSNFGASR
jgi:autotransporter-associated beta strand protein